MKSFNFFGKMLNSEEMKAIIGGEGEDELKEPGSGCVERWGVCNATELCCEGLTCSTGNGTNHCGIGS